MAHSLTQTDVIRTIMDWATACSSIRCALLTSTRAISGSPTDQLSDYDIILAVEDIHPFVSDHTWLKAFGEVLIAYWDPIYRERLYGMDVCANVVQYQHGLKIDFTLWPVELLQQIAAASQLPAELDAGYRVLLDKDHLTDRLLAPTGKAYIPRPPTQDAYLRLVNDFLSDAPYVAKCLWREDLLPAKWCLDCDMKHVYLRPLLEWLVEIEHDWSIPVGGLGKGLKKLLPEGIWSALEQSYASGQVSDNWQALENTMELFRRVARRVGDHFGYPYPDALHQRVKAYVERIGLMEKL